MDQRKVTVIFILALFRLLLTSSFPTTTLAVQGDKEVDLFELHKPVERELAGGQSHSYRIGLAAGQYLRVVVDQRGIDVVVTLFGPDGKKIVEVDSPNGDQGPEQLAVIVETSGAHRLEIRSLEKAAPAGHYQVKIAELRAHTAQDETRLIANDLYRQAEQLVAQGTAASLRAAREPHEKALALYHSIGDLPGEASVLTRMGVVSTSFGDNKTALSYYLKALPLYRAVKDGGGEVTILNNIGGVYDALGERQKALDYYQRALTMSRVIANKNFEAGALSNIAGVYNDLGERKTALGYYLKALPLRRLVKDKRGEATTLNNLGGLYYDLGDNQKALKYYAEALPLRQAVNDPFGEGVTLSNMGRADINLGETQKALDNSLQALSLFRSVGNHAFEAGALANVAEIYLILKNYPKAIDYYKQALPIALLLGDRNTTGKVLHNLMNTHAAEGDLRLAVFYGKQSVETYQQLRFGITELDKNIQKTYLRTEEPTYRRLAELLMEQNRSSEAQQVLNAFKDQQFFDFERTQQKQLTVLTRTALEEKFASLLNKIVTAAGDGESQGEELEAKIPKASGDFSELLKQAESEFSRPADERDKVGEVNDMTEMQSALRQLTKETGERAVAVYTLVGEAKFYALIITADDITSVSTAIDAKELNSEAQQLWGLLQSDVYDPRILAQDLYNLIFKPIKEKLPADTKTILWSLDGNLRYLPMGALYDGKQYLVERYNHVNFTRADSERMTRAPSRHWTGLGLGSSQAHTVGRIKFDSLPGVNEELRAVFGPSGGALKGEVLPDEKFTKRAMLAQLARRRPVVHIASHFSFRPGDEARSFLLLGDGSVLTLAEMKAEKDLFAGVELLTLSACNTAAQQPDADGREIDAFAELAQRLGANAVMATLWPLADDSAPWLMGEFYRKRQEDGMVKADALRAAQLALLEGSARIMASNKRRRAGSTPARVEIIRNADERGRGGARSDIIYVEAKNAPPYQRDKNKPFAHPYYWAPVILIGNWR
jgi:CHAT domain-containing protein